MLALFLVQAVPLVNLVKIYKFSLLVTHAKLTNLGHMALAIGFTMAITSWKYLEINAN
jgi:hypothetical protein